MVPVLVVCSASVHAAGPGAWADIGYWSGWIKVTHQLDRREKTASFDNLEVTKQIAEAMNLELAPADYSDAGLVDWRADETAATLSCEERRIEKDFDDLPKSVSETRSSGQGAGDARGEIHLQVFPDRGEYTIHYYFSGIDVAGVSEWYRDGVLVDSDASSEPCELPGWVTEPLPGRPGPITGRRTRKDGAAEVIVEWQFTPAN